MPVDGRPIVAGAGGSTVKGLGIVRFGGSGIRVDADGGTINIGGILDDRTSSHVVGGSSGRPGS